MSTLRGLEKVSMQAMLTFAAMNLKKLATGLWRQGGRNGRDSFFRPPNGCHDAPRFVPGLKRMFVKSETLEQVAFLPKRNV